MCVCVCVNYIEQRQPNGYTKILRAQELGANWDENNMLKYIFEKINKFYKTNALTTGNKHASEQTKGIKYRDIYLKIDY